MHEQSTPQQPGQGDESSATGQAAWPLLPSDPPRIDDFWLDARLAWRPSGVAYLAHDEQGQVMLLSLTDGAARDANCRDRLAGEVNRLHIDTVVARGGLGQDGGRLAHRFRPSNEPTGAASAPVAPWVALAYDAPPAALAEATRILRAVDLSSTAFLGSPDGPDYQLHWHDQQAPASSRVWPLPWPGRKDRAGWMSIAVSWLLMILLAALALLIAVLLFQNKPPVPPPPPIPTSAPPSSSSASPSSGSPSPSSGSPSPSSGSPSPSKSASPSNSGSPSKSPTPSNSGSPSKSPSSSASPSSSRLTPPPSSSPSMESPNPSGSASGQAGTPTPNKRL